jgi:hypothetical protein
MTIKDEIRVLADRYAGKLEASFAKRVVEMSGDDKSHFLIYRVLGVPVDEGELIDLYQNKGRFLYKYAGSFLEEAVKHCFNVAFPSSGSAQVPNMRGTEPSYYEIDCLVGNDALEIKWRDATTDGDHTKKERARIMAIVDAGYRPIRVMFYYPNRKKAIRIQKDLQALYASVNGEYHYGQDAWDYVANRTGIDLFTILKELDAERTSRDAG